MKVILRCLLAFFILFSTIDLSVINLFKNLYPCVENTTSISVLMKIESDLFYKTTKVVSNVCNSIVKEINTILTSLKQTKTYICIYDEFIVKDYLYYCVAFTISITNKIISINFYKQSAKIPLFFFGFIFIFILKYLGLLFTFDGIVISKQYKKAYSI